MNGVPPPWDSGRVETVVEGVHRIPLPLPEDGLKAVNVYLVEDSDGLTLVDAGWALEESMAALESAVVSLGHAMCEIHDVLATHVHRDHYTQAVWMRERHGSRVSLGHGERGGLERLFEITTNVPVEAISEARRGGGGDLADLLEKLDWPQYDARDWGLPDRWIRDGDRFGPLEAFETPGHTRGHVVLHDRERELIFSGDHVLPHITPSIGFELAKDALPLKHYLTSLRSMLDRPDGTLLPAHGPVTGSCHARSHELLIHHEQRFVATIGVLDAGSTASDVAGRLRWTRRNRTFAELDEFNQMLAINETAAHLDVLVDDGSAIAEQHEGVYRYTATTTATVPALALSPQKEESR